MKIFSHFREPLVTDGRRRIRQAAAFAAVVAAGLLMSVAPKIFESGAARGGIVLVSCCCYAFGIRILMRARRATTAERSAAIFRVTEDPARWRGEGEVAGEASQSIVSLAQAVDSTLRVKPRKIASRDPERQYV